MMTDEDTGLRRPLNIEVDYEKYAHFLDEADMSDEEKRAFAQTVWEIIVDFVSLGFGVHPVQQAGQSCGQNTPLARMSPEEVSAVVKSENSNLKTQHRKATSTECPEVAEGGAFATFPD